MVTARHGKRGQIETSRPLFPCKALGQGRNPCTEMASGEPAQRRDRACMPGITQVTSQQLPGRCWHWRTFIALIPPRLFPTLQSLLILCQPARCTGPEPAARRKVTGGCSLKLSRLSCRDGAELGAEAKSRISCSSQHLAQLNMSISGHLQPGQGYSGHLPVSCRS